ncbi:MAG TPA: Bax inhibitor-1/YccA family protein [Acidimicrobiales bacterium]
MPANPVLTPERFQAEADADRAGWGAPAGAVGGAGTPTATAADRFGTAPIEHGKTMTVGGTLTATGVLLALILAAGAFGWTQVDQTSQWVDPVTGTVSPVAVDGWTLENTTSIPGWLMIAMFVGLGLGLVTAFKPKLARFLAPLYALAYGTVLGAISAVYNNSWDGIVVQAVLCTVGVVLAMFFLYATRIIKVTPKYVAMVMAATFGILAMFVVGWIASIFGADIAFWDDPSPIGIGISLVIVVVAALNLAIDFDFIEKASKAGMPRYMEWYGAFGVTVTIVWIYVSILRLLSLLRQ